MNNEHTLRGMFLNKRILSLFKILTLLRLIMIDLKIETLKDEDEKEGRAR